MQTGFFGLGAGGCAWGRGAQSTSVSEQQPHGWCHGVVALGIWSGGLRWVNKQAYVLGVDASAVRK